MCEQGDEDEPCLKMQLIQICVTGRGGGKGTRGGKEKERRSNN